MSDQVFVLKSLIYLCTKNYKKVYAYFVDFKKAYDTIWRNSLFYKLLNEIWIFSKDYISTEKHVWQSCFSSKSKKQANGDIYTFSWGMTGL